MYFEVLAFITPTMFVQVVSFKSSCPEHNTTHDAMRGAACACVMLDCFALIALHPRSFLALSHQAFPRSNFPTPLTRRKPFLSPLLATRKLAVDARQSYALCLGHRRS